MSLQFKVLSAFLAIALFVTLLLGGVSSLLLNNLFSRYLTETLSSRYTEARAVLEDYYEHNGTFRGVELALPGRPMMMGSNMLIVTDADGVIIVGPPPFVGHKASSEEISRGLPLVSRGRRVGTLLLPGNMQRLRGVATLEHSFRRGFFRGVLVTGGLVMLLALLLGVVVSRLLTRPLKEIDVAASTLGAGDLSYRVADKFSEHELKSLVESFNDMAEKLEQNERSRTRLVADVAHELRTPITILQAALESMLDGVAKPSEEQLASLHEEASRMGRLITDLQDLTSAEAGRLRLKIADLDLHYELSRLLDHVRPMAEEKGIVLELHELPQEVIVRVDKDRFAQVLYNILWNALQYTPEGGRVEVRPAVDADCTRITVIDTGPGIEEADLPHVFDRFYRGDKARHREGGVGLGLSIAREFMHAMGGHISVQSQPGQGSKFTIEIPS